MRHATFQTSLGWITVTWIDDVVHLLKFGHRSAITSMKAAGVASRNDTSLDSRQRTLIDLLTQLADGSPNCLLDVNIDTSDFTPFRQRVIKQCRRIGWGQTVSYADLARRSGSPRAARAVGNVMASNRTPLIVPCHRVVGANCSLGGFSAPSGLNMKKRLLRLERALPVGSSM